MCTAMYVRLILLLPVVRFRAMLAKEMLVVQIGRNLWSVATNCNRTASDARYVFKDYRVVCRCGRIRSPLKQTIVVDQHSRHLLVIDVVGGPNDRCARVLLVITGDGPRNSSHPSPARSHESNPLGCAKTRNRLACLRPRSRELRMCVRNSANAGKRFIQFQVRCQV